MAKNIAAFVDGTWNEASAHIRNEDTNVWKLYKLAAETRRSTNQVVRYVRGVGTVRRKAARTLPRRAKPCSPRILARAVKNYPADIGTWVTRRAAEKYEALTGGILGRGCVDRIREAYSFLCKHYEPGDSVYLFGFSRGAFIARLVAEFTAQVGLLLRPYAVGPDKRNLVERACWLFLVDPAAEDDSLRRLLQQVTGTARPTDNSILPIYFIGAWDTVAAIHGSERVVLNGKDVLVGRRQSSWPVDDNHFGR